MLLLLLVVVVLVVADNYDLPVEEEELVGIMITMVAVVAEAGTTTMTIPISGSSSRSGSGGQVLADGMMMILMSMMMILPFAVVVVVVGMVDLKDEINMTKEAGVDEDEGEKEEDGGEIVVVEEGTIQGAVAVVGGLVAVAAEGEVGEVVGIPLAEVVEMSTTTAILVERKDEIADRVNETRHQQQLLHPREQHMEHPPQ